MNQEATKVIARVKRIAGVLGVPSRSTLGEGRVDIAALELTMIELPRLGEGRYVRTEWIAKARNHSRVASALPHSEGIAYKPPCGEIAMCPRVGRVGPNK